MTAQNYLTYMHLLTPLHTGGSADEGNMMGIAREVHTDFPYLPASSLRGKIRSELERQDDLKLAAGQFFGQKIEAGNQPTEGEVWFADATLLFFPIASLSHHLVWITCPLWLDRWSRWWSPAQRVNDLTAYYRAALKEKSALTTFKADRLYLQTASLTNNTVSPVATEELEKLKGLYKATGLPSFILDRLVIINDEDCISLVETGLQREVRIAIDDKSKTVKGGSFRSEEAIPPEAVLFCPWGVKAAKPAQEESRSQIIAKLDLMMKDRLQFGGLEGLGRGWTNLSTTNV
jgi:CRISPR-associated protein Cmr4